MLRNIGAVLAGLIVGMAVNGVLITLNMKALFPAPPGLDFKDTQAMSDYVAGLPAAAFLVVMAAHLGQAFFGGWLAARLAGSRPMALALIVGVVTLAGGVYNLVSLPGPVWMWVEVPLYLVVAGLAGRIESNRRGTA